MVIGKGEVGPPPSAVDGRGVAAAALALSLVLLAAGLLDIALPVLVGLALAAWAVPIAIHDLFVRRVYRRAGIEPGRLARTPPAYGRLGVKLAGVGLTVLGLGVAYAVLVPPALPFAPGFARFILWALPWLPVMLGVAVAYVVVVDAMMTEPEDALFETGSLALGRWRGRDWAAIREHALAWVIKGFFLPLMASYLVGNLAALMRFEGAASVVSVVVFVSAVALVFDLVIVTCGYCLTLRPLDAHIRSANPFILGWIACLACYMPFAILTLRVLFEYRDGLDWEDWFAGSPLAYAWAVAIVALSVAWIWANMMFGLRFSNLTNRGIVTNGPFRYTKHPSYIAKNLRWWLIHVPFLSALGWQEAAMHSAALVAVNLIYVLRARTEERHLMEDPAYRAYAAWIAEHGLFARLVRAVRPARLRAA